MKTAVVYSMLLVLCCVAACKKEPEKHYVSQEMKDMLGYGHGSFWIMRDSATNEIDSIFCNGEGSSQFSGDKKHQYEHKSIILLEYSENSNTYWAGWNIGLNAEPNKQTSELHFSLTNSSADLPYIPFISIPFESEGYSAGIREQTVLISILPNLVVNGQSFSQVYHLRYLFPGKSEEHFYWNKEAGFLKIVQDNELVKRTLLIERWHIVR